MSSSGYQQDADLTQFLAYTGLRLGEGLATQWHTVDWDEELIHVRRSKKGVFPFVLLLPELAGVLRKMKRKATGKFLFPSPFDPEKPRDDSNYRRRLKAGLPGAEAASCNPAGPAELFCHTSAGKAA